MSPLGYSGKFRVTTSNVIENSSIGWASKPVLIKESESKLYQIWKIKGASGYVGRMSKPEYMPARYLVVSSKPIAARSERDAAHDTRFGWTHNFIVLREIESGRKWRQSLAAAIAAMNALEIDAQ